MDYKLDLEGELTEGDIPFNVYLTTSLFGDQDKINIYPFKMDTGIGALEFEGDITFEHFFPAGLLRLIDIKTDIAGNINADLEMERDQGILYLRGKKLVIGSTGFNKFLLDVKPHEQGLSFVLDASLSNTILENNIKTAGLLRIEKESNLELETSLVDISAQSIYKLFVPHQKQSPFLSNLLSWVVLSSTFTLTTNFNVFTASPNQFIPS